MKKIIGRIAAVAAFSFLVSIPAAAVVTHDAASRLRIFVGGEEAARTPRPPIAAKDSASVARAYMDRYAPDFGVRQPGMSLSAERVRETPRGATTRFQQRINGVPVIAGDFAVTTTTDGGLVAITGKATDRVVDTTPRIGAAEAASAALALVSKKHRLTSQALKASVPQVWVYDPKLLRADPRPARLVWRLEVTSPLRPNINEFVLIDADNASVALHFNQVHGARDRRTYDAFSTDALPGTLQCTEGSDNCTNGLRPDADNAHKFARDVYDFFFSRFGRDSIDGAGLPLVSTVNFCFPPDCPMLNAFWTSSLQQMVYGAGLVTDDIAAHEITHGITSHESGLFYFSESGAINESLSDIFGEFVDLVNGRGNDSPGVRWLLGEDSVLGAIRNMSNPPAFGDPDRKGGPNWYTGEGDNGGVHINSGVGNKAAFLMVDGGTFNGTTVTGIGLEKAAHVYYEAATTLLTSGSNYTDLYNALFQACSNLVGTAGIMAADCQQVRAATVAVQMNAASPATLAAPLCPAGGDNLSILGWDDFELGTGSGTLTRTGMAGQWQFDGAVSAWGVYSARARDVASVTDSSMTYRLNGTIAVGDRIWFLHTFSREPGYDGGVVEYSITNGTSWVDARSLRVGGQDYTGTLSTLYGNPLGGRSTFTGSSGPYWVYSMYDLSSLAGKSVLWRFRSGTDNLVAYYGWNVDELYHYRCDRGTVELTAATDTVNESMGSVVLTVNRTGGAAGAASITYATSNGTAIAGVDYTAASGTLTWLAGDARPKTIRVTINNRAGTQGLRTFNVNLGTASGVGIGSPGSTQVTISDYDSQIQFEGAEATVGETGGNIELVVVRTGFAGVPASVTWASGSPGSATAAADYAVRTGTLTWAAGDSSPRVITVGPAAGALVPVMNDTVIEGPETFTVRLSAPSGGATLGAQSAATITIQSDETGVAMGAGTRSVSEDAGAVTLDVARVGATTGPLTVNYSFTNGTAINGTHYSGTPGTLTWAAGEGGTKTIPVTIADNGVVNAARTFNVTLSGAVGGSIGTPATTAVTIQDNDNSVQFSVTSATVTEGTASLTLTVTRTGGVAAPASVVWQAVNGTAFAGTDFGIAGNPGANTGVLTWAAGDSGNKSVVIPILNDTVVEGAKTFTVVLGSPSGTVVGTNAAVAVTLNDNDSGVAFAASTYLVSEAAGNVTVVVNRIGPAGTAASVTWTTANGSATAGQDFGTAGSALQRSGVLSWAAGDASARSIVVPVLNDALGGEGTETFTIALSLPSAGVVLASPSVTTVSIVDDDVPPQSSLSFSAPKFLALENGGNVTVTVNRTAISSLGLAASVSYATQTITGGALATSDFTTRTGTLSWAAGEGGPKTFTVPITNDAIAEAPEQFRVALSAASPGASITTPDAIVLIVDDDEAFPLDGAMPAGWTVPAGATRGWMVTNDPGAYEGVYQLRSEAIDDGETAAIEVSGTFAAGTVTFRVKYGTEPGFDFLRFYVDGVPVQSWSGSSAGAWQVYSVPLAAGAHTLRWSYEKDGSAAVGIDAAFLDAVSLPAMTP